MKILLVNKFFPLKGGAETSFFDIAKVLKDNGHIVAFFSMMHPENFDSPYSKYFVSEVDFENVGSFIQKIKASGRILYSLEARKKIEELVKKEKPDIVHLNNIHHQISPSILYTLKKYNLPIVMTLHDYKIVCPVYLMFSKGRLCEKCKGRKYYYCLLNRCCKDSYLKSFLNTLEMYLHHSILHVYDLVDVFISPSKFLKDKIAEMGFNTEVFHLPNFINANDFALSYTWNKNTMVYFGRLSQEKGLFTLLSAIKGLGLKCKIIGDGPLKENLERRIKEEILTNVSFFGYKRQEELRVEVQKSMFVVLPSQWYENSPRSAWEAFALGKPVVASRIGGIPELVKDNQTGLTFEPGNTDDLKEKILYMIKNPDKVIEMGKNGRKFVEEKSNPERYYRELMKIYQSEMEKE
ncbi:MAG: glycosyltransferase family 4 protein [Candidatus Bathyarchaeota archaeon]|nr:glycosyltransferase family 4 protein [Candidatus Bathyarchaeota archaeon]